MKIEVWLVVLLVLVLGAGHWLLLPGLRDLARRARALRMWPDLKDEPPWPWTLWPDWTFALLRDPFRRSDQRDSEHLGHQSRVRLGGVLVLVGFVGIFSNGLTGLIRPLRKSNPGNLARFPNEIFYGGAWPKTVGLSLDAVARTRVAHLTEE